MNNKAVFISKFIFLKKQVHNMVLISLKEQMKVDVYKSEQLCLKIALILVL